MGGSGWLLASPLLLLLPRLLLLRRRQLLLLLLLLDLAAVCGLLRQLLLCWRRDNGQHCLLSCLSSLPMLCLSCRRGRGTCSSLSISFSDGWPPCLPPLLLAATHRSLGGCICPRLPLLATRLLSCLLPQPLLLLLLLPRLR